MTAPEREALVKALLPCPFCGGKAEHELVETYSCDSSYYVVRCDKCTAMIHADDELSASDVKAWNARVTRPAPPAVTVTEEMVEQAAKNVEFLLDLRDCDEPLPTHIAICGAIEAALKSPTPQTAGEA